MTRTNKNITLPQTSFVGGNKVGGFGCDQRDRLVDLNIFAPSASIISRLGDSGFSWLLL